METYLAGRVRNFNLRPKNCLVPVFEAVMNSMQAIEDRMSFGKLGHGHGTIQVSVLRKEHQPELFDKGYIPEVVGIRITDNGIGFDEPHFQAFCRLDDDFRLKTGGKGVGRISWLSAFRNASIESIYAMGEPAKTFRRTFSYSVEKDGVGQVESNSLPDGEPGTDIKLTQLLPEFRVSWPKKPMTLVHHLVVHFQKYLALATCPQIVLFDTQLETPIDLKQFFREEFQIDRKEEAIEIEDEQFEIVHVLHRAYGEQNEQRHRLQLLADGRPAEESYIIPTGLGIPRGPIREADGSSLYMAFVSGKLLDVSTNSTRTHVELRSESHGLHDCEVSRESIMREVARAGKAFLGPRLDNLYDALWERINAVCSQEVRYRPLLLHCKTELRSLDPSLYDSRLADAIHAIYRDYMERLRKRTRDISKRAAKHIDNLDAFRSELREILTSWNDTAMSDLAAYVADRRAILWFLKERLKYEKDESYHFEEAVHAVFFPMGFDSDNYPVEAANLWLIDERMAFHDYLASDKALRNHTTLENELGSEPDIAVYHETHAFGLSVHPRNCITLVEFKRPGRDEYTMDDNPYTQAVDYIIDIRDGTAKYRDGRPISDLHGVHFTVYIICDKSKKLNGILQKYDFSFTTDGRGFFKHLTNLNAYFEVLTFEKLVDDAVMRNKVLFDKLQLPPDAGGAVEESDSHQPESGQEESHNE